MSEIELYHKIGHYVNKYHSRRFRSEQVLKDFQHDIFLNLREKDPGDPLIARATYLFPWKSKYFKINKDGAKREIVILNDDGGYIEFEGGVYPSEETESLPTEKKEFKFTLFDDTNLYFDSIIQAAQYFGVCRSSLYRFTEGRTKFTNRKLSHIKSIMREYLNHNPFSGSKLVVTKVIKRETYEKTKDKYEGFTYDTDKGADYNEWYMLLVNESGQALLIKEAYEESKNVVFP